MLHPQVKEDFTFFLQSLNDCGNHLSDQEITDKLKKEFPSIQTVLITSEELNQQKIDLVQDSLKSLPKKT